MADQMSTFQRTTFMSDNFTTSSLSNTKTDAIYSTTSETTTERYTTTTNKDFVFPVRQPITLEDILGQYWEYNVSHDLGLYGYPIIIILGTLGNLLTFIVMLRPKMRHRTTCFYMMVVAVFDTLVLYFACLRQWLSLLHDKDPLTISPAACKTLNFCSYASFDIAVWLLVLMTVDRFLVVRFPFHVHKISSLPKARRVVVALVIIMVLFNGHFFWTIELDDRKFCNYLEETEHFHNKIWPWLDASVYSFVPFFLLLVFNILIIIIHRRSMIVRRTTLNIKKSRTRKKEHQGGQLHLSSMLLIVTFSFLVLSAPNVILTCIRSEYFDFSVTVEDFHDIALYRFLATVTNLCLYLNHAINFLLYCMAGQLFRQELKQVTTCDKFEGQRSRSSVYSDAATRPARLSESSAPASPALSYKSTESYV